MSTVSLRTAINKPAASPRVFQNGEEEEKRDASVVPDQVLGKTLR